ncbi:flagellar biosynthesis protein [Xinfangfangia sp. CPCC 101601]|uniref:Flagellar biosynthesis protein n=1 Tax=Pseudogemmobacter lacusdianii TaxID=3069608 RepID=A0ABU0VU81_9RHOB|nr:flagellar biosynthesis protein [Xinfangfangia sp. CPCC 101601]MDQ2065282.1 flagellar biosynthesis protein [Xinfangfangia sp. CPCC 101601]
MVMPKLEVFDVEPAARQPSGVVVTQVGALEEARLAAYEQGYKAGWDDAAAAQSQDQNQIKADLARNLQQLAFTYQEARAHMLQAVKPLFEEMVNRLLPATARETLAPLVLEQVTPMAEELTDQPVTLVLNPSVRQAVASLITQATGLPMVIEEEPTLPEGQVYIRLGSREAQVDLSRVTAEIAQAVHGFFTLAEEPPSDG